jgi:hypothetical protein
MSRGWFAGVLLLAPGALARQRDVARARRGLRAVIQAGGTSFDVEQVRRLLIAL